jgi:hypothetical protein
MKSITGGNQALPTNTSQGNNILQQATESGDADVTASASIAQLAYALWEGRGSPVGSSEQDWIEAERQLGNAKTMAAGR